MEGPTSDENADDSLCAVCLQLLYEPVRTTCGHHYCLACWDRLAATALSESREPCCPTCRTCCVESPSRDHARELEIRARHPIEWERRHILEQSELRARARASSAADREQREAEEEAAEAEEEQLADGRVTRRMGAAFLRRHAREQSTFRTVTLIAKLELTLLMLNSESTPRKLMEGPKKSELT